MITTASGKELDLCFKTRSMEHFEERFSIKNSMDFWKEAAAGPSLKVLEIVLVEFSNGAIKDVNAAADFIDDYIAQDGKTTESLYLEIIQEINAKGFFKEKLTAAELSAELETPVLNMAEIVNRAVQEAGKEYITETGRSASKTTAPQLTVVE